MLKHTLTLKISEPGLAICRFSPDAAIPARLGESDFVSITRTPDELSIVCGENSIPDDVEAERNWRLIKVMGPLDFSLTGILASLISPLADAGISIFAISTFDTDYLLVKKDTMKRALGILQQTCIIENPSEQ